MDGTVSAEIVEVSNSADGADGKLKLLAAHTQVVRQSNYVEIYVSPAAVWRVATGPAPHGATVYDATSLSAFSRGVVLSRPEGPSQQAPFWPFYQLPAPTFCNITPTVYDCTYTCKPIGAASVPYAPHASAGAGTSGSQAKGPNDLKTAEVLKYADKVAAKSQPPAPQAPPAKAVPKATAPAKVIDATKRVPEAPVGVKPAPKGWQTVPGVPKQPAKVKAEPQLWAESPPLDDIEVELEGRRFADLRSESKDLSTLDIDLDALSTLHSEGEGKMYDDFHAACETYERVSSSNDPNEVFAMAMDRSFMPENRFKAVKRTDKAGGEKPLGQYAYELQLSFGQIARSLGRFITAELGRAAASAVAQPRKDKEPATTSVKQPTPSKGKKSKTSAPSADAEDSAPENS